MRNPKTAEIESPRHRNCWSGRDWLAAASLFLASAAVVLWQNAHLVVIWDASYTLETSFRIALGQMPYRDFPLVHTPLTFLIQAAIMRLTGRVFFHHVLYAAILGGLGTVLAWRIALEALRGRLPYAWAVAFALAAPLTVLGIYSILPFPSYDCDTAFSILVVIWLWQRLPASRANRWRAWLERYSNSCAPASLVKGGFFLRKKPLSTALPGYSYWKTALAGAALPLPLFFKQNIGLPFLTAALVLVFLLLIARLVRRDRPGAAVLGAILAGAGATLLAAGLLLHITAGLGNCIHWTIRYAGKQRLPGWQTMLGVYAEPTLLWWLPGVAAALLLLRSRLARNLWARLVALGLLAAPFVWTLAGLFLSSDADDRASNLLALWPLLLVLSLALTLWNLLRAPSLRALLPFMVLAAIHGTLLSQQLWGSTYAIWPLLVILMAEMIAFLASIGPAGQVAEKIDTEGDEGFNPRITPAESTGALAPGNCFPPDLSAPRPFSAACEVAPALAAIISVTLIVCGGLYTASEDRLSYAQLPDGPVVHATAPALKGMADPGPFLPDFEELLRFAAQEIPASDGLILIPGEDPFYFATGRAPQFPVLLFDRSTDPLSPAELVAEAQRRNIRWLIVKRRLQIKEDVTPRREETLDALQRIFLPYRKLGGYDVYRRP